MNNLRAALLSVSALASLATIAACSGGPGGGNPSDPCCAASGQTEAPPSAFGALSFERLAQPIAFLGTGSCLSTSGGTLSLPPFEALGDEVEVGADGRYLVEIDEEGAGQRVFIRVFDRDEEDIETDRGIAALARIPIADPDAPAIPVAPIRFGADPTALGESTLEIAVFCEMRNADQLQNLSFSDVRAVITSSFAAAYTGTDNVENAATGVTRYRHAINGVVNLALENKDVLERLREEADALVDACRSPEPPAGLDCSSDGRAEFYRYWYMARRVDDADFALPLPLVRSIREHLQSFAQDMSDAISDSYGGDAITDPRDFELFRENHKIRLEIAAAALESAATCFGEGASDPDGDGICEEGAVVDFDEPVDTGRGPISMRQSIASIREGILAAPDEAAFESLWTVHGRDLLQNFAIQAGLMTTPGIGEDFDLIADLALNDHQVAAQFAILTDATHVEIAGILYGTPVAPGVWQNIFDDLEPDFGTLLGIADHRRAADVIFYSTANATDITTP